MNRPVMISIASWNAQGNPLEDSLGVAFLQFLFAGHDIVVLQSCGALVGSSFAAFRSVCVDRLRCDARGFHQPISVDPFCSVAILSRIGSAFPLEGGAVVDHGRPGVFGVGCDIVDGPAMIALHAAPAGIGMLDWQDFAPELRRACAGGRPLLMAVELAADWEPAGDLAMLDARGLDHPSPGRRHDSFLSVGLRPLGAAIVLDSAGASDHDAVSARFG